MAYDALGILLQSLDQFSSPNRFCVLEKNHELQSFIENLKFLKEFVQTSPSKCNDQQRVNRFEGKIRDAAYEIQDLIECFVSGNLYQSTHQNKRDATSILANGLKIIADRFRPLSAILDKQSGPSEVGSIMGQSKSFPLSIQRKSELRLFLAESRRQSGKRNVIDIFNQKNSIYPAFQQLLDEIDSIKVEVVKIDEKISTDGLMVQDSATNRFQTEVYEENSAIKDDGSIDKETIPISSPKPNGAALLQEVDSIATGQENIQEKKFASRVINQEREMGKGIGSISINQEMNKIKKNTWDNAIVGLDADLYKIKELITGGQNYLQCVTILGMGGIGKTTLAKLVFDDPYIQHHFYIRAWITVSQVYELRDLLLVLLKAVVHHLDHDTHGMNKEQLRERLYRHLKGQRFLIVLDDMWNTEAWDYMRRCFPDDKNGSRMLLTTWLKALAEHISPNCPPHQMSLLNNEQSWELLHAKISLEWKCPPELVGIGKKIADKCKGLPLAIVVIAGVLSKMSETRYCWEKVAGRINSLLTSGSEQCLEILAMSYNYLPHHLKACFLYLCVFPEDCEIQCWRLIRMWIAEGLVEPKCSTSLETIAEEYLEDLIKRSLVLVGKRSSNGKIKTCFIHELVRDLSLREARKENFVHVMTKQVQISSDGNDTLRRLTFHSGSSSDVPLQSYVHSTRSFLCFAEGFGISWYVHLLSKFKLLRVLDIGSAQFGEFPPVILELTLLRFLALATAGVLPSSLYKLWNLQTLVVHDLSSNEKRIFRKKQFLTIGIWLMPHLRHLKLGAAICLPCPSILKNNDVVLENLQTLSRIRLASCTKQVLKGLPNLKKLGIYQTKEDFGASGGSSTSLSNLVELHQLETLKCCFFFSPSQTLRLPHWDAFPPSLKNLSLSWSNLPWEHMETLGMLPNLKVLKLKNFAFQGPKWEPNEGGFQSLKLLLIENTDLVHWIASKDNFPCLQYLILRSCESLEEIPHDIADDLLLLELYYCSSSAERSAREIEEEQRRSDNNDLVIHIGSRRSLSGEPSEALHHVYLQA